MRTTFAFTSTAQTANTYLPPLVHLIKPTQLCLYLLSEGKKRLGHIMLRDTNTILLAKKYTQTVDCNRIALRSVLQAHKRQLVEKQAFVAGIGEIGQRWAQVEWWRPHVDRLVATCV